MKRANILIVALMAISLQCISQDEKLIIEGAVVISNNDDPNPVAGTLRWTGTDFEGFDGTDWVSLTCCNGMTASCSYSYTSVVIGSQEWMVENLTATCYNDNTPIPLVDNKTDWINVGNAGTPAYSWPLDDPALGAVHGAVYNWFAIDPNTNGGKNVCPVGWHVATVGDFNILQAFIDPNGSGNSNLAGQDMKSPGTSLWDTPNVETGNPYNFTAHPTSNRSGGGLWDNLGYRGTWWTSTENSGTNAAGRFIEHDQANLRVINSAKEDGYAVRCVKD